MIHDSIFASKPLIRFLILLISYPTFSSDGLDDDYDGWGVYLGCEDVDRTEIEGVFCKDFGGDFPFSIV